MITSSLMRAIAADDEIRRILQIPHNRANCDPYWIRHHVDIESKLLVQCLTGSRHDGRVDDDWEPVGKVKRSHVIGKKLDCLLNLA